MASWEDLYDDSPANEPATSVKMTTETEGHQMESLVVQTGPNVPQIKEAPPKPVGRGSASDAGAISHAYNAGQPKVRILQRAAPAQQQNRGSNSSNGNSQNDESVARLHANFEQKQRDYEAARKKLFHDSEIQDANGE